MFVRQLEPQISTVAYPLRRLARFFAFAGIATVVYASALIAIAINSAIIEF